MEIEKLKNYTKGWFIGNFEPSFFPTEAVEVAIKTYKKGDKESTHYHKVATEITAVVAGRIQMNEQIFEVGDIIKVLPGEAVAFEALEDSVNIVVKLPTVSEDKYIVTGLA